MTTKTPKEMTTKLKSGKKINIDVALADLIFSGLSLAKIEKIPDWVLVNIEENKDRFCTTITQNLLAVLKEGVEKIRKEIPSKFDQPFELAESVGKRMTLDEIDTLLQETLGEGKEINSIIKE